jgi:predicted MPP superfamily phosphohydrolase
MPRLAWLTDLHLNFVEDGQIDELAEEIRETDPAGLLIGGDLGEASSWESYLHRLDELLAIPIYFVLGNHDYYGGSLYNTV